MAGEFNYWDDICAIQEYIKKNYSRKASSVNKKSDSQYWAANKALEECSKNMFRDPWDVLDELIDSFQVNGIFSKQLINKEHYNNATEAVEDIKEFLKRRRNL